MRQRAVPAARWHKRVKRAAFAGTCIAIAAIGWLGYRASDSQVALTTLWRLCAPAR